MKKIFIHTNDKQFLGAKLAEYTFLKHGKNIPVHIIRVEDYPQLMKKHGVPYLRNGTKLLWNTNDLQSFTLTRFLPPTLMNFDGTALVVDPDVFALSDPNEIFDIPLGDNALAACFDEHNNIKKFKSSVMLLNCGKLKHWNWDKNIEDLFQLKRDYRDWMGLKLENESDIMKLPDYWNHCDILDKNTRFIHYTLRRTQPWKTGLPQDFSYDPPKNRKGKLAYKLKKLLNIKRRDHYLENPNHNQVNLFLKMVKSALDDQHINKNFMAQEINKGHVRADLFQALSNLPS